MDGKILALDRYAMNPFLGDKERVALDYANAITPFNRNVKDAQFAHLRRLYNEDAPVEFTAVSAGSTPQARSNAPCDGTRKGCRRISLHVLGLVRDFHNSKFNL